MGINQVNTAYRGVALVHLLLDILPKSVAATPVSVDPRHEPHRENDVIQSVMSLALLQMIHANGYRRHIAYSLRDL